MALALATSQLLELSGIDAARFANAQFANEVMGLQAGHWQWNAWLSPQGRVRYFFALLRETPERILLWLRGGNAEALRAELVKFVFRSQVSLRVRADLHVLGCDEAEVFAAVGACPERNTLAARDSALALRLPFGARWLLLTPLTLPSSNDESAAAQWQLDDIHAGLPLLDASLQDQLLPQWLGLDRLPAFSTSKGCYPGQEVIARLHFKGGNKRWLHHISFTSERLPSPGARIADTGILVNAVRVRAHCAEALAVLSDMAAASRLGNPGDDALSDIQVISRFS
jgi:folate-binding protein YgfZ